MISSNPDTANPTKIKSIQLNRLEGAAITLDDFNSTLKNNNFVYTGDISSATTGGVVKISTKPIEQLKEAKTADIIDPDDGELTVDLSEFFTGGTGDYIFGFDDVKPNWITLDTTNKILKINPPKDTIFLGGTYIMHMGDSDQSLYSPINFQFTVDRVKAEVNLTVNYDDTLGTVTPKTGKVTVGDDVVIRAEANGNAYIKYVMVDGVEVDLNNLPSVKRNKNGRIISCEYTLEDISGIYLVEVEFRELPTFRVKVSDSENGFVTVATAPIDGKPDYTYYEGADVGLSVVAANGYRIKSAKLNGNEVTLTNGSYTIENLTANHEFDVEFEKIPTFNVAVSKTGNGTVTVEPAALSGKPDYTFAVGTDVTISVSAANGYRIKSVKLDGTAVTLTNGKFTIANLAADHAFSVEFEQITYKVDITKTAGGNVTVETAALSGKPNYTFKQGTKVTVTVTPNAGYTTKSVKLDGAEISAANGKYIFTVTKDCTLSVEFKKKASGGSSGSTGGNSHVYYEQLPSIRNILMTWDEISAELEKIQTGGSEVVSLNSLTNIPSGVIRTIMNNKLHVEFVVDGTKSWIINGADITRAADVDLYTLEGLLNADEIRGDTVAAVTISSTSVPAVLRLKLGKENAGRFANIYKNIGGKLVFCGAIMVDADGFADFAAADLSVKFAAKLCDLSDLFGDVNNDGALNALDASAILMDVVGISKCENMFMGDFNNDGIFNALDASAILMDIMGISNR